MNFRELLNDNFILVDGAMGTMLQSMGMEPGTIPEILNIEKPEWIIDIHRQYIDAGAQIIYANTFGANAYKLEHTKYSVEEIIHAAVLNAKEAVKGTDALVALDMGPIGKLLEPSGDLSFDAAYAMYKEQIEAAKGVDLVVLETMTDLLEIKAALLAVKENSDLPVICTMTFEENLRTFTGCRVSSMALTLSSLGADAIGVNCSLGPKQLLPIAEEMLKWTNLPVIVKPNAGLPDPVTNLYDVTPEEFAGVLKEMAGMGVEIFGGCCGTTPEYIAKVKEELSSVKIKKSKKIIPSAVCSPSTTVVIDRPRIIGERINPTGKKLFKEALKSNDMDYIMRQAVEQVGAGAEILDVNVGLPEIDEKEMMIATVKRLQGIIDVPLQIDSTIPEVLSAALRIYSGKPIVNSVNGEDKSLDTILPLVKKYGAAVIGLTLDENGIPATAEGRFKIAEKILKKALSYGIPKEDVFIDCLTLTVSAEQAAAGETLKAVNMVKTKLGLKNVLGVSNISFGLPNRELINKTFLTMALTNGLDLPIINPNVSEMTSAVRAYKVLANIDENSKEYIDSFSAQSESNKKEAEKNVKTSEKNPQERILYSVENGLKEECEKITGELLELYEEMEIINDMLIPALDEVGDKFEKGKMFLPQLILSAEVAKGAFEVIKKKMINKNSAPVSKGKIVLATVKGDIHDIGKNIVKVILENYGYQVIDLGKDVPPQTVVDAIRENDIKLAGLSALMTTTLASMEETIALIHKNNLDCKVVVGGAVLTREYAETIHADFYAKDAKETADIAKKVLG